MKKLLLILVFLVGCSSDKGNCEEEIDMIFSEYNALLQKERLGDNNPGLIRILEQQRDKKLLLVCK